MTGSDPNEQTLLSALRQIIDPEIGCNIVDLGLVYSATVKAGKVRVTMTLTTPGCPMHESILRGVKDTLTHLEGITAVEVDLVWDPPWNPSRMTDLGRRMTGVQ